MKKILLFICLLIIVTKINFAQNVNKVDKRALNYYTTEEINNMPLTKINQINYLYTKSFIIPDEFKNKIKPDDIDIRLYSGFRKQNERAKAYIYSMIEGIDKNNSNEYIILLSISEIQQAFKEIELKYDITK
jgi:hypothetical protein